ncbi:MULTISPECIES: FAD-dependent oxidoreductase [unclassified Paenibacillus]|uniref:NAD(P)/FAD-dependent oxidoreductase n=1 Tax=unclassified Paenibacillus TaxID=185978 RepID=UPI0010498595|nr:MULTISPECIES: FAD-dependent oxidoreductase [unclassified Paenibacillus]NIK67172.1 NADH dehydrogenase [Paenibacillus sp. BK720]TCN01216.1 NADH dehydrogenase [Paenibacillus sp. BK033]
MKEWTVVVVGGGYAGIHAVKAVWKQYGGHAEGRKLRLLLLDPNPYHLRKVLLFKPAVGADPITVPWRQILPETAEHVQGKAKHIDAAAKVLEYENAEGQLVRLAYDTLVVSVGSVARETETGLGGIALTGMESAVRIRDTWSRNMQAARAESSAEERRRLLTAAVAGAGITGMETASELAYAMREEAARQGLNPEEIRVHLLNAQDRLFREGSMKASRKLEDELAKCGVSVHHLCKAVREENGCLMLSDGEALPVGLTVWTLGLVPNPAVRGFGLPVTKDGRLIVDECYRVKEARGVYAIGDCAFIVDPDSGEAAGMTCKEAIPQAQRLGKIIAADRNGSEAPRHKQVMEGFTIGLGPGRGITWTRKWGLDIIISGSLSYKIKRFVWDYASMLKS